MATKAKSKISEKAIIEAYLKEILLEGKRPPSVFKFMSDLGAEEAEFYSFFTSFDRVEEAIWTQLMEETLKTVQNDTNFAGFTAREKLLGFYYTHLEILKTKRSFVSLRWPDIKKQAKTPAPLRGYKEQFTAFSKEIVVEGIENDEIKERPYLSENYDKAFWVQLVFVVDFWLKDNSKDFEQSDAAVEKAVNLSFRLLGESTLDSVVDFAKFLWQSK